MIKEDIVDSVAKTLGIPKHESLQVVDMIIDAIKELLEEGHKIEIREFGTFRPVMRKEKLGRIIATGGTVKIPARLAPKFIPGRILKKIVMTGVVPPPSAAPEEAQPS